MAENAPATLYNLCINTAVADCVTLCKFCNKEFRILPDNVLFDFYFRMYTEKRLCLLGVEFSDLEVFSRMLKVTNCRPQLLQSFQALMDHGANVSNELVTAYVKATNDSDPSVSFLNLIDMGLRLGGFLSEAGWYMESSEVLLAVERVCKTRMDDVRVLRRLLDCYHKCLHVQAVYCMFKEAAKTYESANSTIMKMKETMPWDLPNLAGLYAEFSVLYFIRSEYDEAYKWSVEALKELKPNLPTRVIVDVLRQAAKSCVVKRRFTQAGLLIRQAASLARQMYKEDKHPNYSDTLMDYGFFLLNFDSIQQSVQIYEKALEIRKSVFEKYNIHVAVAHEDLAYALYVNEYSSGRFVQAREHAEKAIRIMDKIMPKDHLMLASAKRVKALILEEIALDLRDTNNPQSQSELLTESEDLHKAALRLSHSAFGERNVQTAKHYGNLGRLYQSMRRYEDAEKMHLRAIAIKEELLGSDDYEVGLSIGHLASLYNYHMERHHDAEQLYQRSIDISLKLFGHGYSGLEYDYRGLVHVYTELEKTGLMLKYSQLLRDWKQRRDQQVPESPISETPRPLDELTKLFFSLSS